MTIPDHLKRQGRDFVDDGDNSVSPLRLCLTLPTRSLPCYARWMTSENHPTVRLDSVNGLEICTNCRTKCRRTMAFLPLCQVRQILML